MNGFDMSLSIKFHTALLAVTVASLAFAANASAVAYQVNTEADSLDGVCDSQCSIRDAVAAANAAPTNDEAQVPPGHYSIDYGPISLIGNGEIEVEGPNPRTATIDANGNSGVFVLGAGAYAEIKRVAITGGGNATQGGGVFVPSGAVAEIKQVTITGNAASEQGGGIYNAGELELEQSTVNGNRAGDDTEPTGGQGGGIYNAGEIDLENLTVTDNHATGGTSTGPRGGGIFQEGTEAAGYGSSTISNNSAGDGGDGGGVAVGPSSDVTLTNTIVANNQSGLAGFENCSFDDAISESGNLESGTDCGFTGSADRQQADPLLGPLQNNQGFTDTRAPAAGSPALDALDFSQCPTIDQRTMSRPQGSRCDIGAFEVEAPGSPVPAAIAFGSAKPFSASLSAKRRQHVLRQRAVIVSVDCDRACKLSASGTIAISQGASRTIKLRKATKTLTAAGRATLKLKLSQRALASVRRAFSGHKRLTASVSVRAKDSAGVASLGKQKIRLRP
jgi:CSLREA domain-containing protein